MTPAGGGAGLRSQLPAILIEAFSVIFAVLLALGINEWRETRARERLAADALVKLRQEVATNRENLGTALERQRAALEELTVAIEKISEGESREVEVGLVVEQLRNAAWESTILTDAARYMDFELVSTLSDVYHLQELVDDMVRQLLTRMTSTDFHDSDRRLNALRSYVDSLAQLVALEKNLMELYDEFERGG